MSLRIRYTLTILAMVLCSLSPIMAQEERGVIVGAADIESYIGALAQKRVALLANHTAVVDGEHIVDILQAKGVNITGIFAPEHGFRGSADAGEVVKSSVDAKSGIKIRSLYNGNTHRPSDEAMRSFDILLVDMQDVGVRFYTYYIAMLRMIDACADFGKSVIILDRPNPHGAEVDGPLLDMRLKSGVGAIPVPVLHGLTMGEIALMAMGEGWSKRCNLEVVKCLNYTHSTPYKITVAPSPNLRTQRSIELYPSLCLFEGTVLSVGRGTEQPFECFGHPNLKRATNYQFSFTPRPSYGAKEPLLNGKECYGVNLRDIANPPKGLQLDWVVEAFHELKLGEAFFKPIFDKLVGTTRVREMILQGYSADEIESTWRDEVEEYMQLRKKYLIYDE